MKPKPRKSSSPFITPKRYLYEGEVVTVVSSNGVVTARNEKGIKLFPVEVVRSGKPLT